MEPIEIVGTFSLDEMDRIFRDDHPIVRMGWEKRFPNECLDTAQNNYASVNLWHQDKGGESLAVFLWTNVYPTEFLLSDGRIFIPQPTELVVFDNLAVRHRTNSTFVRLSHLKDVAIDRTMFRRYALYEKVNAVIDRINNIKEKARKHGTV